MNRKNGAAVLFVGLLVFWMILSTQLTLTQTIIGGVVSFFVVMYNYDLVFNEQEATKLTFKMVSRWLVLFYHLLVAIVKSHIHVAMIVLSPKMKIKPGFKKINNPLKKELNQALFANAITLTPGTLTVDMSDDYILVHGLEEDSIESIETSAMQKAFERLES